jgi:hypothetical protein
VRVSSNEADESPVRAIKIKSQPEAREGSKVRMASRRSRLARLRCTALPVDLPAATPTRTCGESLAWATNTTSGWAKDFPFCRTRLKSSDRVKRNLRCTHTSKEGGKYLRVSGRLKSYHRTRLTCWLDFTANRWRPLRRRRFITSRPSAVAMRWRKPCTRTRRRIFG